GHAPVGRPPAVEGTELNWKIGAGMWTTQAPVSLPGPATAPGVAAVDTPAQRGGRVRLRWRGAPGSKQPGALVRAVGLRGRVVVEDSFGDLAPGRHGSARNGSITVDRMPLMLRPPGGATPPGSEAPVVPVITHEALVQAE